MISENIIRKIFLVFNFLFVLTGAIFILCAIGVNGQYNKYNEFLNGRFYSQTILFIVCGCLTFLIAIFGYYGTYKKNSCLMLTFCGTLILLFILAITAGSIGMVLYNQSYFLIQDSLDDSMKYYTENKQYQKAWDNLQETFNCCGNNGYKDWNKVIETNSNTTVQLPFSCCRNIGKIGKANCTITYDKNYIPRYSYYEIDYEKIRSSGCLYNFQSYIMVHAYALGIVAFTFSCIQLVGIGLSFLAAREVRKSQGRYG